MTARDDYSVKLARLPSGEISGTDKVVQAVYQIVSETDDNRDAYLVAQKDPSEGMTTSSYAQTMTTAIIKMTAILLTA